jgi:ribosomal protein S18 acetylase RimI-like enzyme
MAEWVARRAALADVPAMARAMARAFFDDPLISWWLPDEASRLARATRMFEAGYAKVDLRFHEVWTTDGQAGAATWAAPGTWKVGFRQSASVLPATILALRATAPRLVRTLNALEARHPTDPHWYLAGLGTDPSRQRTGVGMALMAAGLAHCDDDCLPAYLETQTEANVPYYGRFGFEVVGELDLARGGPHMWLMRRPPRAQ